MEFLNFIYLITCLIFFFGNTNEVEIHFEDKDSGFFIRQGSSSPESKFEVESESNEPYKTEQFTVFPSNSPVGVRVSYGPFSTKQTVPVRLLVPDPIEIESGNGTESGSEMIPPLDLSAHLVTQVVPKDNPILRVLFHAGQTAFGLPIPIIPASNNNNRGSRQHQSRRHRTRLCLVAQASRSGGSDVVSGSCSPSARDSTCLAELTLPMHWWPQQTGELSAYTKLTKIPVQVSYAVYEPENGHCNEIGLSTTYGAGIIGEGSGTKRIQIQPLTPLATSLLVNAQEGYKIVRADESEPIKLYVPQGAIYPHAKFYVPLTVSKRKHETIVAINIRARVKSGIRIIGIEPNLDKRWNISTEFNPRRTHASVTAIRKYDPRFQDQKPGEEEVFNWILEAAEEANEDWDDRRIVWIYRYVVEPPKDDNSWLKKDPFANFGDKHNKITTRVEIQKDDIQAVLPITKSWEIVNTAVLDGKQVSRQMKVFIVSRAGQVADVTLQTSCRSLDESVLKVSSSCTSVYVDGSEIRGSTNASIAIKYGTYEGSAIFTAWMPEFQLDVTLSDNKLNQIRGWRVPNSLSSVSKSIRYSGGRVQNDGIGEEIDDDEEEEEEESKGDGFTSPSELGFNTQNELVSNTPSFPSSSSALPPIGKSLVTEGVSEKEGRSERGQKWTQKEEDNESLEEDGKLNCRLRYQHARIDVYARFLASDHDSGRTSYFISKKTYLKVTDLITDYLRVSDTQIANIKGATPYVQGLSPGSTEIQVVSPVTGRVLGSKEVRVVNDKVSVSSMRVQVISGVQLSLFPDTESENEFIAETTITSKLSAKYQEALLDISLWFSDNTHLKLDEIDKSYYVLAVDSLEPSVVELPPIQNSKYPRILAVSEGGGPIMRVSLELSDQCHRQNSQPLAMSVARVEVNFTSEASSSEFTQNDSNQGLSSSKSSFRKTGRMSSGGMSKERSSFKKELDITGIPLKDDGSRTSHPSSLSSLQSIVPVGFGPEKGWNFGAKNTALEIAMYVLLGVFSLAILVFVASCVVYASRVKKRGEEEVNIKFERSLGGQGSTNAHDWVWLGRASLALHPSLESSKFSKHHSEAPLRIIPNPNFSIAPPRPPKPGGVIDSSTFVKTPLSPLAPPIPPHRNLQLISPLPSSSPSSCSSSSKNNGGEKRRSYVEGGEFEFDEVRKSEGGVKLVRNPMCYLEDEGRRMEAVTVAAACAARRNHRVQPSSASSGEKDNVKLSMDYDQLMEYFDSLKETEA